RDWGPVEAGEVRAPQHAHAGGHEAVVGLDGEGGLLRGESAKPGADHDTVPQERHAVRRGSVVPRPAGTRIPHSFLAGKPGLTYLAYGTRDTNDICWYPRSNKVFFRGLGVIARLELLEYSDGEPR